MTTYGIEIECASPISRDQIAAHLQAAGIRAAHAAYSGRDYSLWQVKDDVTIPTDATRRHRAEIVSPVLTWGDPADDAAVQTVSRVLAEIGCKVLKPQGSRYSTGLHVHMQFDELTPASFARWVRQWHAHQSVTDSLVRSGRHAGGPNAAWCSVLDRRTVDRLANAAEQGDTQGVTQAAPSHGLAVNTQWWAQRGTLEIRQRDGSTNWKKILGWVAYINATRVHALEGTVYTGHDRDYLTWLVDQGYLTQQHREWAERNLGTTEHVARVESSARARLSNLRRLQGIA